MRNRKRSISLLSLAVFIALFLIIWLFSLHRCEVLTHQNYHEFESAWQGNTMLGAMDHFKILSCDGEYARVYYISEGYTDANVLSFQKMDGIWTETSWTTVWSAGGSASDVIWPYWWHFIYGGL